MPNLSDTEVFPRDIFRRVDKSANERFIRCFLTKAVFAWNALDDGHIELASEYFARSESFGAVEIRKHLPRSGDPLFAVFGRAKK